MPFRRPSPRAGDRIDGSPESGGGKNVARDHQASLGRFLRPRSPVAVALPRRAGAGQGLQEPAGIQQGRHGDGGVELGVEVLPLGCTEPGPTTWRPSERKSTGRPSRRWRLCAPKTA
ncbi:MAG TPA: hypothetical protein VGK51_01765 [Actinomycetota bacterium]